MRLNIAPLVLAAIIASLLSPFASGEDLTATATATRENDYLRFLNGGVALAKIGKIDEAIVQLRKAATIKPDAQLVLVNLGQAYQLAGNNAEALEQYKKYLTLYPQGPHVAQITNMFKAMQSQLMFAGKRSSQGQDNYLAEALAPGGGRWDENRMPLRIFIADGRGKEGYKDEFIEVLKKSFADWCEAAQGKVSVSYADSPEKADITCKWTARVQDLANPAEGGQAFVQMTAAQKKIIHADLLLLTRNENLPASSSPASYMRLVCLHEIGHALGMVGHSSQPGDVMFSVMNYGSALKDLSERDRKTIMDLYSSPHVGSGGALPDKPDK